MKENSPYKEVSNFPGINALRFFAAYLVVLHHLEQIRMKYGLENLKNYTLFNNGGLGVTFFFALSGFLITYLLLREHRNTNTISIRKFYVRRVLRIWPLYFLLVLLGTVVVPAALDMLGYPYTMPYTFGDVIVFYIFFMPFVVNILFGTHFLEPLWSIGVEELFYLGWAPLIKFFRTHVLTIIISVIAIKTALLLYTIYFPVNPAFRQIVGMLQFEAMAMGGLTAYLLFHAKKDISSRFWFSPAFQLIVFLFLLTRIFLFAPATANGFVSFLYATPLLGHLLIIIAFCWLIVNIGVNRRSLARFEQRSLHFLGDISYGIYMYHMLIIFFVILLFRKQLLQMDLWIGTIFIYVITTTGVVVISALSRKYFEGYFLRKKPGHVSLVAESSPVILKEGVSNASP